MHQNINNTFFHLCFYQKAQFVILCKKKKRKSVFVSFGIFVHWDSFENHSIFRMFHTKKVRQISPSPYSPTQVGENFVCVKLRQIQTNYQLLKGKKTRFAIEKYIRDYYSKNTGKKNRRIGEVVFVIYDTFFMF